MLVEQYICDFNKHASGVKFLQYTDEIILSNKLKLIRVDFSNSSLDSSHLQEFFSHLYNLLCQSSLMRSELLDNCLEILLASIISPNSKVQSTIVSDFRFLSICINILINFKESNEQRLIKLLEIVQELINYSSEMDERNLKLIVEVLRDHTVNHESMKVNQLCLHILANLCLDNCAAKYFITTSLKSSEMKNKIKTMDDRLLEFKIFVLIEDEILSSDVRYFLEMSLKDIRARDFNLNAIKHSLDILKQIETMELKINFRLSDEEKIVKLLSELSDDLIEKLDQDSPAKQKLFDGVFQFFKLLLQLDDQIVKELENFTERAFVSADISKSVNALKYLSTFLSCEGALQSHEIIVESLLDHFTGSAEALIDFRQVR
jgi:hypothetical protein